MAEQQTGIPAFDVPDFDGATAVFGAPASAYLTAEQLPGEFYSGSHPMCRIASQLFFRGGRLRDHGIRFKPDVDQRAAMRAIQGLLGSFEPKHEVKIGTVGVALANWCELITEEVR